MKYQYSIDGGKTWHDGDYVGRSSALMREGDWYMPTFEVDQKCWLDAVNEVAELCGEPLPPKRWTTFITALC